jgi:hypothetical protein
MSGSRVIVKTGAMREPESAAKGVTDALRRLYERIEALESRSWFDVRVQSDSGSSIAQLIYTPPFRARGVYLAAARKVATGDAVSFAATVKWDQGDGRAIRIGPIAAPDASTDYALTFRVEG